MVNKTGPIKISTKLTFKIITSLHFLSKFPIEIVKALILVIRHLVPVLSSIT